MTAARKAIRFRSPVSRTIEFLDCPGAVKSAAVTLKLTAMSSPRARGVVAVPVEHADDIMSYLEGQGHRFQLVGEVLR